MTTRAILNDAISQYIPADADVSHEDGNILVNGEILPQSVILMIVQQRNKEVWQ